MNAATLALESRRLYERSRAINGAGLALVFAAPFGCVSMACCAFPRVTITLGLFLGVVVFLSRRRGQWLARGLYPGLVAGSLGFVLPIACRTLMPMCSGQMCFVPLAWVVGVGIVCGGVAVALAPSGSRSPTLLIAYLLGSMGALAGGLAGPVALAGGVLVGAAVGAGAKVVSE
ncbi:MAG: hypothetical protein ABIR28_00735 [Vicinamibacteria bacterium]